MLASNSPKIVVWTFDWLQTSTPSSEDGQKAVAAAGLGLAVLAGLCRVPTLAMSVEFIEKIPLLLQARLGLPIAYSTTAQLPHLCSIGSGAAMYTMLC